MKPERLVCILDVVLWNVFVFRRIEDTAQVQGVRAALGAFEAAYTAQVIRAFFRLDAVFAQLVTSIALCAFAGVESQKERRDTIEQREYRAERAEQSAPGPSDKEDSNKEQNENRQL